MRTMHHIVLDRENGIYEKYPELNIPNTTNSLDGCFAYLKELVRVHRGSRRDLKDKIIEEILRK
jgi:hypothetical protein